MVRSKFPQPAVLSSVRRPRDISIRHTAGTSPEILNQPPTPDTTSHDVISTESILIQSIL